LELRQALNELMSRYQQYACLFTALQTASQTTQKVLMFHRFFREIEDNIDEISILRNNISQQTANTPD
jgi:hypothetical protein